MPIYEYRCGHCGEFEEMQRITDPPLVKCPRCGRKVQRLISQTSFQLKGSGWYVTDYGRGGSGKKSSDDAGSSSGSSDGKAESKAESKADTKPASSSEKPAS